MRQSGFEKWQAELNLIASDSTGLFLDELPPFDVEPHYRAGLSPRACFDTVLLPELAVLGVIPEVLELVDEPASATFVAALGTQVAGLDGSSLDDATDALDPFAAGLSIGEDAAVYFRS